MNRTILALGLSAWLCGCGTDDSSDPGPDLIPQTYRVSECGGFQAASKADFTPQDYCAAEVLSWTYDKATHALKLTDSRALLNCCGDRTMTLTEKNGLYQIVETDAPQQGSGRCNDGPESDGGGATGNQRPRFDTGIRIFIGPAHVQR
jgi:hypothetical protein